jgi:long-subunit fatty acid transport protein
MDWGDMYFDDVNGGASATFRALNDELEQDYGRVYNVRVGGEFTYDRVTLRAGIAFEQDPLDQSDVFDDGVEADFTRDRTTGSFGASIGLGNRATLDLGYSYTQFDDANVPYFDPAASPFVNEDVQRSRFLVGVRVGI